MKHTLPSLSRLICAALVMGMGLPAFAQGDAGHAHEQKAQKKHTEAHADSGSDTKHAGHEEHENAATELALDELKALGGVVAIAGPTTLKRTVTLPGEIRLDKEAVAHVSPRYAAQIVEVNARIGDVVEAGDTLAVAESSQTLQRFELKSLVGGTVIDRHASLGEQLQPSDAAFEIADLTRLWVDIALYPRQIGRIKQGQPVRLTTAFGPKPVTATVDYIAPLVDEQLRTGLARVYLDNEAGHWKPGMFVEAEVTLAESPVAVAVPPSALINYEGETVVFVREGERWHPRPVTLGEESREQVEILSGLEAGEAYVSEGGFVVKANLLKSELEAGHHH
ncbi:efflux RND transporter periplasmic adaptor subunit [Marinimicrobium agarilyticum]|uniref:efflux RND transporter periplasmic adaptor subunit n=1 Tax=Marinimicrobium agarilyticum TaxID=306546 RepID=UPI000412C468|nr:efflux RND transporter periplasmic adaptor subunit [Marinimicrobium agarilyticum]